MIDKEKAKINPRVQWAKFIAVIVCYLLFLFWVGSWWGTNYSAFHLRCLLYLRRSNGSGGKMPRVQHASSWGWVDALVFALVAVYFINLFFFQNFCYPIKFTRKESPYG